MEWVQLHRLTARIDIVLDICKHFTIESLKKRFACSIPFTLQVDEALTKLRKLQLETQCANVEIEDFDLIWQNARIDIEDPTPVKHVAEIDSFPRKQLVKDAVDPIRTKALNEMAEPYLLNCNIDTRQAIFTTLRRLSILVDEHNLRESNTL